MAKFCTYCGKQLEEGTTCDCPQSQAAAQAQSAPQQAAPQPTYAAPNPAAQAIGNGFKSLLTIVNKPMETMQNFLRGENFIVALILVGAQALIAGFFSLALLSDFIDGAKAFFLTLLFSLVLSAVLYGSLFLFTLIFKGKIDAKTLLCVVSIRSVIVIPFMVLGLLLGLASPGLGMSLFVICEIFAMFYLYQAMKISANLPDSKVMFIIPIAIVIVLIVYALIMQGVAKSMIMDMVDSMMGRLSGLSGLGGLY